MSDPIVHLHFQRPVHGPDAPKTVQSDPKVKGPSFSEYMKEQIEGVNSQQLDAAKEIEKLATGETGNIGHVMATVEKSDAAFRMLLQVRNQLLEAYQDVMRMPI